MYQLLSLSLDRQTGVVPLLPYHTTEKTKQQKTLAKPFTIRILPNIHLQTPDLFQHLVGPGHGENVNPSFPKEKHQHAPKGLKLKYIYIYVCVCISWKKSIIHMSSIHCSMHFSYPMDLNGSRVENPHHPKGGVRAHPGHSASRQRVPPRAGATT